jgi:hypothetical protein
MIPFKKSNDRADATTKVVKKVIFKARAINWQQVISIKNLNMIWHMIQVNIKHQNLITLLRGKLN